MNKLVTDDPKNNLENMLNYAYAKNGKVFFRMIDGVDEVDICDYISEIAQSEHGCAMTPDDVYEGGCTECGCEIAILYAVAGQAAELRARLKEYEDTGMTPEEIQTLKKNDPLAIEYLIACRQEATYE